MRIINFLSQYTTDKISPEKTSRREAFRQFGNWSRKAAAFALPLGISAIPRKISAQTTGDTAVSALQLALTLEYLENEFYVKALDSGVLPPGQPERVFMQISKHESAHVDFLYAGLENADLAPVQKPNFDFTAGGAFDPFNDTGVGSDTAYVQMLALAQAFEDTGVRAYKGQAANLMGSAFLTAALQIHSVEARHASEIRRMRGLKGWITGNMRGDGMPEATQAVYNGEENTMQGGVDVTSLNSGTPFSFESATEAYDEPLSGDDATAIAGLFIMA
ncbi:MAG: ferritin-like domain-containing protein [Saprospiraceae bacterium]|nr:ferritin-like domain-containing protein [Saprospiraceae bacterium]